MRKVKRNGSRAEIILVFLIHLVIISRLVRGGLGRVMIGAISDVQE